MYSFHPARSPLSNIFALHILSVHPVFKIVKKILLCRVDQVSKVHLFSYTTFVFCLSGLPRPIIELYLIFSIIFSDFCIYLINIQNSFLNLISSHIYPSRRLGFWSCRGIPNAPNMYGE